MARRAPGCDPVGMTVATVTTVAQQHRAAADARVALGVAAASAAGLAVFVLVPHAAGTWWQPPGVDLVWLLGTLVTVFFGPLAAGLAGWSSLVALWTHGAVLPTRVRRTHLVTLVLVAAYGAALAAAWGAGAFAALAD